MSTSPAVNCHIRPLFAKLGRIYMPCEIHVKPRVKFAGKSILNDESLCSDSNSWAKRNLAARGNRHALNWPHPCGCYPLFRISRATTHNTSTVCGDNRIRYSHDCCSSVIANVCGTFDALRAVYSCHNIQSTAIAIAVTTVSSTRYFHHSLCEEPSHTAIVR